MRRLLTIWLALWFALSPLAAQVRPLTHLTSAPIKSIPNNPYEWTTAQFYKNVMFFFGTCGAGYTKRYFVAVPHQNFASTLTNYPLLLSFNGASTYSTTLTDLKTIANGGLVNNIANNSIGVSTPADLVFCNASSAGSAIKYEVAAGYSATTGLSEIYAQIASASNTVDSGIWMFIGNSGVVTTQQDLSLWSDASFIYVWHGGSSSTLNVNSSTGQTGTNHSATATAAQISGGAAFVAASSQYIDSGKAQPALTDFTTEAWITHTGSTVGFAVSSRNSSGQGGLFILYETGGSFFLECGFQNGSNITRRNKIAATGVQQAISCVHTGGVNDILFYNNGVSVSGSLNDSAASNPNGTNNFDIGAGENGTGLFWNDKVDEVRISSVARSADWVASNYANQLSPAGFYVIMDASTPTGLAAGTNCIPINILAAQVPNTDRTNYQLTFWGMYPWMADVANGGYAVTGNSGHDIRLYSNSGCTSLLNFQLVTWSNTTGMTKLVGLVPSVSHTTNTPVYLKIGATGDTSDVSSISGTWPAGWIGVYQWGSPTSLSLVSNGTDGITLNSNAGSPDVGVSPMGAALYIPNDGATTVGWTALAADTLSSRGYRTGSGGPRHLACWTKNTINTNARCANNGDECTFVSTGKANQAGDLGAFQLQWQNRTNTLLGMPSNPGFGTATGTQIAALDGTSNISLKRDDLTWTKTEVDYPAAGGATSTMTLYKNGVAVTSPFTLNPSSVINTGNGSSLGVDQAELRFARDAGHGVDFYTGFIGFCTYTNTTYGADEVATRYNNESAPYLFYSFGTSAPVTSGSVRHRVTNQ